MGSNGLCMHGRNTGRIEAGLALQEPVRNSSALDRGTRLQPHGIDHHAARYRARELFWQPRWVRCACSPPAFQTEPSRLQS